MLYEIRIVGTLFKYLFIFHLWAEGGAGEPTDDTEAARAGPDNQENMCDVEQD